MSERSAKTTRRQIRRAFTPELAASIDANFALLVKQIKLLQMRVDALEGRSRIEVVQDLPVVIPPLNS